MKQHDRVEQFVQFVQSGLQRGMSRREFIRHGLALGLSLPTIVAILSACGVRPTPPQGGAGASAPAAANPTAAPATATPAAATTTPKPAATQPPPTATPTPPTRFAVIGDFGLAGEPEQAVAELVKSWTPEFIITTGDNNYPNGTVETIDQNIGQYYHDFIFPYQGKYGEGSPANRFFPVLGNHDWVTPGARPYLDYFTLPGNERYYSFTWGPVGFFALDSDLSEPDGVGSDSVQARWLKKALAASLARWNVVYMHHPPFSSGHHGSSPWMQWPYCEWGAHVVLSGHDHSYERLIVDDLLYLVNGLGGGARYAPGSTEVPGSQAFYNANHGAMLVEATGEQITFQFTARSGEVIDSYELR